MNNTTIEIPDKEEAARISNIKRDPYDLYSFDDPLPKEIDNRYIQVVDPFDDTPLNQVVEQLKKHGIALAKIIFMIGTASATLFGGLAAGANSWEVMCMVWGSGFILECLFAYSWVMTGNKKIAGRQDAIVQRIFKVSSLVMMGDLITMLLEAQAGAHQLFVIWTSIVQPLAAVYLMNQIYKLKNLHPETIAMREMVNLHAGMKASALRDKAHDDRLRLAEKEHERALEWAALRKRHEHAERLVSGRWYDREIKRATKAAVGQQLDGMGLKLGKLPKLLKIGKARSN